MTSLWVIATSNLWTYLRLEIYGFFIWERKIGSKCSHLKVSPLVFFWKLEGGVNNHTDQIKFLIMHKLEDLKIRDAIQFSSVVDKASKQWWVMNTSNQVKNMGQLSFWFFKMVFISWALSKLNITQSCSKGFSVFRKRYLRTY